MSHEDNSIELLEIGSHSTKSLENYATSYNEKRRTSFLQKSRRDKKYTASDVTTDLSNFSDSVIRGTRSVQSETHSYRDKIRQRFKLKKIEVEKSLNKSSTEVKHTHLTKENFKHFGRENESVENQIKAYETNKSETRSEYESYIFFCEDQDVNEPDQINEELNASAELLITNEDNELCKFNQPEQLDSVLKITENALFWKPTGDGKENIIFDKSESNLGNEGFYIPDPPHLPKKHLNLLEARLLDSNENKWFSSDGSLNFASNPCVKFSVRPSHSTSDNLKFCEYISVNLQPQEDCEEIIVHREKILELYIDKIQFTHHPLFSVEHVLQQKLCSLYNTYSSVIEKENVKRISSRLDALRQIKKASDVNESEDRRSFEKIHEEICSLRDDLFKEGQEERDLLKSILKTWKTIKNIREQNKYSNTPIRLVIKKENCDYSTDNIEIERKIKETCGEIVFELTAKYRNELRLYREELRHWKTLQKTASEIASETPKKPVKAINEEEVEQNVRKMFQESFRSPGEPIIRFELRYDHKVTENIDNVDEKLRRNSVNMTKIHLRILSDNIEVCKSKQISLNDMFECNFKENISIKLAHIPVTITVEIYEQANSLLKRKSGEVLLNLPSRNSFQKRHILFEQYFKKEEILHYKHEGVGSGVDTKRLLPDLEVSEKLNTAGVVFYNISWDFNMTSVAKTKIRHRESKIFNQIFTNDGLIDITKLKHWMEKNNTDPENPKNTSMIEYIKMCMDKHSLGGRKKFFRLNPLLKAFEFCSVNEIENNVRFKILQLRDANVLEFSGFIVPNRLKEIPVNVLHSYERKNLDDDDANDIDEELDIDKQRSQGMKYLKKIFMKVFQMCRNTQNNLLFEDVVDEKILANFEVLVQRAVTNFLNYFRLNPIGSFYPKFPRTEAVNIHQETTVASGIKIKVYLKSAINIPERESTNVNHSKRSLTTAGLRPFVEIKYGNTSTVSKVANGSNAVWNQELTIQLDSSHCDYLNPDSLSGCITVYLYDNIDEDSEEPNKNCFLGSVDIPISSICSCYKMEGFFNVSCNQVILGYDLKSQTSNTSNTCLYLSISTTSNIPKLHPPMEDLPSNELPYVKDHISQWNQSYNSNFPNRKFSAFVIDNNCKTSCITRYIKALEPPQMYSDGFDITPDQCARYVSFIPVTNCNKFYQNVCLTGDQVLKLMAGSVLDHAIMLTCYFLTLKIDAWLLLGFGIPHGSTAYVLCREFSKDSQIPMYYIYDALSANKYKLDDQFCPLKKIFCVANEYNSSHAFTMPGKRVNLQVLQMVLHLLLYFEREKINGGPLLSLQAVEKVWANIQRTDNLINTNFDFSKRSEWNPLFSSKLPAPSNTTQLKITYNLGEAVHDLELRIEKKIRKKFTKLRKLQRTLWNHSVSSMYKNVMKKFEVNCLHGKSNIEFNTEINRTSVGTFKINGIISNVPYVNTATIVTKALSFGIQAQPGDKTEFGVAVYINPYPAQVLSIWIFVAAIDKSY